MRKMVAFAIVALICSSAGGCAIFMTQNMLEVVNQSSYEVSVTMNGSPQEFRFADGRVSDRLRPGESVSFGVFRSSLFTAKAWSGGEFVATANFRKEGVIYGYGSGYYSGGYSGNRGYPEAWIIRDDDFDDRGGWARLRFIR